MSERKILLLKKKLRTLTNHSELVDGHRELAELLFDAGRHQDALDHLKEGLSFCSKQLQTAKLQRLIGEIYIEMGRSELAEPYFRQYLNNAAKDIKELQKSQVTLGRYLYIRAMDLKYLWAEGSHSMLKEAKSLLDEALSIGNKLKENGQGDQSMLCRVYLNLGLVAEELQGAREAAIYLRQARILADEGGLREEEFRCLTVTASLFRRHGGTEMATGLMQGAALKAAMKAGAETQCQHALDYAEHLIADQKLEEAEACLANAVKLKSPPKTIRDLVSLKYKEVRRALRLSREASSGNNKFPAMLKLAKFYSSTDCCAQVAIDMLSDKVGNIPSNTPNEQIAKLHRILGLAYRINCDFAEAMKHLEKASVLQRRPSTLRELAVCKLCTARPCNEVMSLLEEAGRIEVDLKGFRSVSTLDQMIYTKKSFGLPADDLAEERSNLSVIEEESSDSDSSTDMEPSSLPVSDDDNDDTSEKIEVSRNNKGETPLHIAAARGQLEVVKKLLFKEKHAINVRDFNGWLPLHEAVNFNRLEVVKLLLDNGAAINDRGADEGTTPLHDAAQNGLLDCIELLLNYGANPCLKNAQDLTPLDVLHRVRLESDCSPEELKRCKETEKRMLDIIRKTIPDYKINVGLKRSQRGGMRTSPRKCPVAAKTPKGNVTDACKSAMRLYCDNAEISSNKRKRHSPPTRQPGAFVSEEDYDLQFTVDDDVIEYEEPSSSSSSPEVKTKSQCVERVDDAKPDNCASKMIRVIVHVDSSPQARLLIPFNRKAILLELKNEIESRIRRKLSHLTWKNSELYDSNDCMLDETDRISDLIGSQSEQWDVKIRLLS